MFRRLLIVAAVVLPATLVVGLAAGSKAGWAGLQAERSTEPGGQSPDCCTGTRYEKCYPCGGTGKVNCYFCSGAGRLRRTNGTYYPCDRCDGTGKKKCIPCDGSGVVRR